MHLLGQAPAADGWTELVHQFGVPVAVLMFAGAAMALLGKRIFAKDGWLDKVTDRCVGEHGIVTAYVTSTEDMVRTLKVHLDENATRMSKIVDVEEQVSLLLGKLSDKQDDLGTTMDSLVESEIDRHLKVLASLEAQTRSIDEKVDGIMSQFERAKTHQDDQRHLIEAALVACDVLDAALPESTEAITAVRKKLTG